MTLNLITGPARSGKTRKALEQVVVYSPQDWISKVRYVVPTVTMAREIEDRLMEMADVSGILGNIVCTFYNLCEEIVAGSGYLDSQISDVSKSLMIRDLIQSTPLKYFERSSQYPHFVDALGRLFDQLKLSKITPDDLKSALNAERDQFAKSKIKIEEIESLYRHYQSDILIKNNLHDREGLMWLALERSQSLLSKLDLLVFDGFGDLNGIERELVKSAVKETPHVVFTLDFQKDQPQVFSSLNQTRNLLLQSQADETVLPPAQTDEISIRYLERSLFKENVAPQIPDESLWILESGNPAMEVELVGEEIRKLIRENKWAFSDIAITARNIDNYRPRLDDLSRHGIPLSDTSNPLISASIAQLLIACLNIVKNQWKRSDVLHVLKSEQFTNNQMFACRTEINAHLYGILSGREKWFDAWDDSDQTQEFRTKTLQPLADFEDRLINSEDCEESIQAVRNLVETFHLRKEDHQHAVDAAASKAILEMLGDILESHKLNDRKCTYLEIIDEIEMALSLGKYQIPRQDLDCVQVIPIVDLATRRFQAVFILGMLEGVFPRQSREDSFLDDSDRRLLNQSLENPLPEQLSSAEKESYYFYTAIASAEKRLYFCYPLVDASGKETLPSFYLRDVQKLFNNPIKKIRRDISKPLPEIQDTQSLSSLLKSTVYLLSQLPETKAQSAITVYNTLLSKKISGAILSASKGNNAHLTDSRILSDLGKSDRKYTCTELETYEACPFMYFCQKTLGLEPVRQSRMALDRGSVLHNTLFTLLIELRNRYGDNLHISTLNSEEVIARANEILKDKFMEQSRLSNLPDSASQSLLNVLKSRLDRYIRSMIQDTKYDAFTPAHFELEFGNPSRPDRDRDAYSTENPLVLQAKDGRVVSLCGKIDRVDECHDGVMVIDYKSGSVPKKKELDSGLKFQTAIYASAMKKLFDQKPVGFEYRSLNGGKPCGYYQDVTGIVSKNKGLAEEELAEKISTAESLALDIVQKIHDGKIPVEPVNCENYCSYKGICRIEDSISIESDNLEEEGE